MEFEFDHAKSESNKHKHGIGLDEAQQIWQGAHVEVAARAGDEPRSMVIGVIRGKFYACVYTIRGEAIRLISCRRARQREVQLYYEQAKAEGNETS